MEETDTYRRLLGEIRCAASGATCFAFGKRDRRLLERVAALPAGREA